MAVRLVPTHDGDKAGLLAFQNDEHYYFLAVARVGGQNADPARDWTLLQGDADGTIPGTQVAGGFVGTLFGLYAFSAAPWRVRTVG